MATSRETSSAEISSPSASSRTHQARTSGSWCPSRAPSLVHRAPHNRATPTALRELPLHGLEVRSCATYQPLSPRGAQRAYGELSGGTRCSGGRAVQRAHRLPCDRACCRIPTVVAFQAGRSQRFCRCCGPSRHRDRDGLCGGRANRRCKPGRPDQVPYQSANQVSLARRRSPVCLAWNVDPSG